MSTRLRIRDKKISRPSRSVIRCTSILHLLAVTTPRWIKAFLAKALSILGVFPIIFGWSISDSCGKARTTPYEREDRLNFFLLHCDAHLTQSVPADTLGWLLRLLFWICKWVACRGLIYVHPLILICLQNAFVIFIMTILCFQNLKLDSWILY